MGPPDALAKNLDIGRKVSNPHAEGTNEVSPGVIILFLHQTPTKERYSVGVYPSL